MLKKLIAFSMSAQPTSNRACFSCLFCGSWVSGYYVSIQVISFPTIPLSASDLELINSQCIAANNAAMIVVNTCVCGILYWLSWVKNMH